MNIGPIGIFGGTFDPFHHAHLRIAKAFRDEIGLSSLHVIPTGNPYHRKKAPQASAQHRLNMATLAVANEPRLLVDDREVRRTGPSYTVETLEELRNELGKNISLWLLIGSDILTNLSSWKDWQRLLELANLALAIRTENHPFSLPIQIQQQWEQYPSAGVAKSPISGTIRPLLLPPVTLSASVIRERLACNDDVSHLISAEVLYYIQEHELYVNKEYDPQKAE